MMPNMWHILCLLYILLTFLFATKTGGQIITVINAQCILYYLTKETALKLTLWILLAKTSPRSHVQLWVIVMTWLCGGILLRIN